MAVELPSEFAPWVEQARAEVAAARGATAGADVALWDNPRYAICGYTISREGADERVVFEFNLQHSTYSNFMATQRLDDDLVDGRTPRELYLKGRSPSELPAFMCNSLGAHVLVATADGYLLFRRRSPLVRVQPGRIGATVSEGLSRGNDNNGQAPPDLWGLAERGLHEEVGLKPQDYTLTLLGVGLATDVQQWVMLFLAELSTMTADEVLGLISRGVRDDWEHDRRTEFIPFLPAEALGYLTDVNRWSEFLSVLPPLVYHALVFRHGRRAVERELGRIKRRAG